MLSYHLVFNQKSIIAPLDIGDEEINLNRRWILNRERDRDAQIKIPTSKVEIGFPINLLGPTPHF